MTELSHRRVQVHRERVGLCEEGLHGVNPSPANVEEALGRLREVEGRSAHFHKLEQQKREQEQHASVGTVHGEINENIGSTEAENGKPECKSNGKGEVRYQSKQDRLADIKAREAARKTWKEGRLVHRSEQELKTHTSYLVFAVLPREWSEEDERRMQQRLNEQKPTVKPFKQLSKHQTRNARKAGLLGDEEVHHSDEEAVEQQTQEASESIQ